VLVIDATIAVDMALAGGAPGVLAVEELVAPALMWSESTSALHELAFRGEVDGVTSSDAIARLSALGIARLEHPELHPEASRIARKLGWAKTYDAEYVALARLTGSRLLTRDARLRRGASSVVTIVGPAELGVERPG
jgi:predicted nucleic acid-binding protein